MEILFCANCQSEVEPGAACAPPATAPVAPPTPPALEAIRREYEMEAHRRRYFSHRKQLPSS